MLWVPDRANRANRVICAPSAVGTGYASGIGRVLCAVSALCAGCGVSCRFRRLRRFRSLYRFRHECGFRYLWRFGSERWRGCRARAVGADG